MSVTLLQFHNRARWYFMEKGLQNLWNQYTQLIQSQAGSGVVGGTTVLDTLDTADGNGTGFQKDPTTVLNGPFAASGAEATVSGFQVPPADPGGHYSPTPARISQDLPTAGFRT